MSLADMGFGSLAGLLRVLLPLGTQCTFVPSELPRGSLAGVGSTPPLVQHFVIKVVSVGDFVFAVFGGVGKWSRRSGGWQNASWTSMWKPCMVSELGVPTGPL